ncbi:TIGR04104 family putative zinc finger protein [Lentibacillus kapialis]|uniref:TIGR04104 family putative zinc finger protein n=1 Tax=Lentibacillus kapialis TaxID=340214 RepID=UPI0016685901|nr:TIGR04104 family putative zinc finger protein [Lentibacillus kapialis]
MPTCENCNTKWSWKQTIKKTSTLDPAMTCPYCGEKQYQTQKSKTECASLIPIILLPNFFIELGSLLLILFTVLILLCVLFHPFFVEISNKEAYINFFEK